MGIVFDSRRDDTEYDDPDDDPTMDLVKNPVFGGDGNKEVDELPQELDDLSQEELPGEQNEDCS